MRHAVVEQACCTLLKQEQLACRPEICLKDMLCIAVIALF